MNNPAVVKETPIPLAEVKERLKKIKKRDGELTFRGTKTEEYINQFFLLKEKEAKELFQKLQKLNIPRMKDEHMYKIVDLLPRDAVEMKNILSGYNLTVTNENVSKLLAAVEEFLPKKKEK